jgi:TRAP-type uncharacterized transport system substrate-binding protein
MTAENIATNALNRPFARWSRLLLAVGTVVGLAALTAWLVFALIPAMPQPSTVMATYPEGSLNAELVKRYQQILVRKGIKLKLAPSAGAVESVALLRDPKSGVSVALIPGGITSERDSPELVSLGTMFYQPLWVFSRRQPLGNGQLLQGHKQRRNLRISIGPEGSSSRKLSMNLLGRAGAIDKKSATLLSYSPSESAEKLIDGEIDVAIFLDGWESPAVQRLLNAESVNLESIPRADAFDALYSYLSKLVLPAGVVDMTEPKPRTDISLIATKSSLVVRNDLHPAIQYMLLETAVEIHSTPGVFRAAGQFPIGESIDLPLSRYAREFYKTGTPFLLSHLPFWLAVLLAQPIVWLIPVLIILFPIFRIAPIVYDMYEKGRVYRLYSDLKHIEDEMAFVATGQSRRNFLEQLDRLKARASHLRVPTSFRPLLYSLRLHIELVREETQKGE